MNADAGLTGWRKSSRSSGGSNNCVEVALSATPRVGVRDTKDRAAGHLTVTSEAWSAFLDKLGR